MTARLAVLLAVLAPAAAQAAGIPAPAANRSASVGAFTVDPGRNETRVQGPHGSGTIPGRWAVAPATLDGDHTGLSADGRTLVLSHPGGSRRSAFAVVDTRRMTIRREIRLRGWFTLDAVAPEGRSAYLVQYASGDPLDYRVRALDTGTGTLAAADVVDPRHPDEKMTGLPLARAVSPGGRWVYTLYSGGSETFVHALDTTGRTAACIDLEMIPAQGDIGGLLLRVRGDRLLVRDGGELVATVDRHSFEVSEPAAAAAPPRAPQPQRGGRPDAPGDDGFPWLVPAIAAAAAALLVAGLRVRQPSA
jgi:hypothetical protein